VIPAVGTNNQSFPIVSTTYILAYTRYSTNEEAKAIQNNLNNVLGSRTIHPSANDQIAQSLGFSLLNNGTFNSPTVTNQLRGSARACVATITFPLQ
jgi:hypothetical protein